MNPKKKVAYIAHPISGNIQSNLVDLARILRIINKRTTNVIPFCPYYGDCFALDDNIPAERKRGIDNDLYLLQLGFVDELWMTGPEITKGMALEAEIATKAGIPIFDFTNLF